MKTPFLFIAALALVGVGCASNVQTQTQTEASSEETSLQVPAPGFENVEEMTVQDEDGVQGEVITDTQVETQVEVETQADVDTNTQAPSQDQAQTKPEDVLVTIVAKAWEFEPSTIRVKEGQRVNLQVVSIDVTHGFNLAIFGVNERLEPGTTVRTSFVADRKGTFSFFCDVFCGDGHGGMRGTLIVE